MGIATLDRMMCLTLLKSTQWNVPRVNYSWGGLLIMRYVTTPFLTRTLFHLSLTVRRHILRSWTLIYLPCMCLWHLKAVYPFLELQSVFCCCFFKFVIRIFSYTREGRDIFLSAKETRQICLVNWINKLQTGQKKWKSSPGPKVGC